MKKSPILFHLPKYMNSLIIVFILTIVEHIILEICIRKINYFFNVFFSFIGQTLAYIFYYYKKKSINASFIKDKNNIIEKFNISFNSKSFIFILICTICDLISKIGFRHVYFNKKMVNLVMINEILDIVFLFIFIFLLEHFFLKIPIHRHHIFGIALNFFGMIIALIFKYIILDEDNENNNFTKFDLFLVLLFSLEIQYLITLNYVIPKKVNTEDFIDMNLICFYRGLIGSIISILIMIINHSFEIIKIFNEYDEISIFDYFIIPIYCIISCILNVFILKLTEESRPCYNLIPKILSNIFHNCGIDHFIITYLNEIYFKNKKSKKKWKEISIHTKRGKFFKEYFIQIISFLFSLIGILIFTEIITVSFFNLDKFTKYSISRRSISEVLLDIENNEKNNEEIEVENNIIT